jgi:hypothetical protein
MVRCESTRCTFPEDPAMSPLLECFYNVCCALYISLFRVNKDHRLFFFFPLNKFDLLTVIYTPGRAGLREKPKPSQNGFGFLSLKRVQPVVLCSISNAIILSVLSSSSERTDTDGFV